MIVEDADPALGEPLAAVLAGLHAAATTPAWPADGFAALLRLPGTVVLLARDDGPAPAGFLLARRAADEAEIITLAVAPARRRRGIARSLLEALVERLHAAGTAHVFLEVAEGNGAARALYESGGFRTVGRRRGYYAGAGGAAGEDAVVMRRDLAP